MNIQIYCLHNNWIDMLNLYRYLINIRAYLNDISRLSGLTQLLFILDHAPSFSWKVSQFTSIFSSHQYLCYLIHCRGLKVLICKELTSYKRCVTGMAKSGSGSRMVFFSLSIGISMWIQMDITRADSGLIFSDVRICILKM